MFRDPIKEVAAVIVGLTIGAFKITVGVFTILAALKYLQS
tara:strand:+ start:414 stop:533 length:120 start_codon:yes stop_codon:yes gene_type:complete